MIDALGTWLEGHEATFNILTLWLVTTGFFAYSIVKEQTWWEILGSRDQGEVGQRLKLQKAVESIAWFVMSAVYFYAIMVEEGIFPANIWVRSIIRLLGGMAIWAAVAAGIAFLVVFKRYDVQVVERRKHPPQPEALEQ